MFDMVRVGENTHYFFHTSFSKDVRYGEVTEYGKFPNTDTLGISETRVIIIYLVVIYVPNTDTLDVLIRTPYNQSARSA